MRNKPGDILVIFYHKNHGAIGEGRACGVAPF